MSNVYLLEPHTNGKVILHTNYGDIAIELWPKEAPKACRNFVQLCMEGYYDTTIFHRIVAGFIIQGGDPEGTGHGGESCFEGGRPFSDEFHSRLRFVRRGLVAMANSGTPNDNRSQFFITLDSTMELQNKHTIFGKVEGDTIFNVLKIGSLEVDKEERPIYPPIVSSTTIVINPFDDIAPRISRAEKEATRLKALADAQAATAPPPPTQKKQKKNIKLLSFADDASDLVPSDDDSTGGGPKPRKSGMVSSHDVLHNDPTLSRETAVMPQQVPQPSKEGSVKASSVMETMSSKSRTSKHEGPVSEPARKSTDSKEETGSSKADSSKRTLSAEQQRIKARQEEISQLENDIRKLHRGEGVNADDKANNGKEAKVSLLALEREQYKTRKELTRSSSDKKRRSGFEVEKEQELVSKLVDFESKVFSMAKEPEANPVPRLNDLPPCAIHGIPNCESCQDHTRKKAKKSHEESADAESSKNLRKETALDEEIPTDSDDEDDVNDFSWMNHKLVFEKDLKGKDVSLQSRRDDPNEYLVIDPLDKRASTEKLLQEERALKQQRYNRQHGLPDQSASSQGGRVYGDRDRQDRRGLSSHGGKNANSADDHRGDSRKGGKPQSLPYQSSNSRPGTRFRNRE